MITESKGDTPMKELKTMTKKERKEYYKQFRGTWSINPLTRRENKNKYKERVYREKERCNRETF